MGSEHEPFYKEQKTSAQLLTVSSILPLSSANYFKRKVEKLSAGCMDPLLLLEPSMWITSSQTHSQTLRIADVCLLFESQGRKYPFSLDCLPSSQPNKLKLADFSSLVAELVK